ncbi:MAG: DNA (cytosine-5-)-methyltransferase [Bacteroidales bacterium]|nr:DNA (cytosine-5-)-methyltransferase [Bacteroidales bacterium]
MWKKNDITFFRRVLLEWFNSNKREFPWRKEKITNYEVIISEILLQRTKAETVAKYYPTFFKKYPNWNKLKNATVQDLETILKPLGLYKHRANRLFKIIQEYIQKGEHLPQNKDELSDSNLSTLYISNAYELLLLNHRAALLDVNMSRVLSRFFSPQEFKDVRNDKLMQELAHNVINVKRCKELNWAILDFAALVCRQSKPRCTECKLKTKCRYYELQTKVEREGETEEPQLNIQYDAEIPDNPDKPIKVLSLFSGCGGMDLGFEGDFLVHKESVNELVNPDFIKELYSDNYVRLNPTKFQTVFANDILQEARNVWVNYFKNKGFSSEVYHVESIVDLVKLHKQGVKIFPDRVDIVTGGFPCQDFSLSGLRNGFNSHKDHTGKLIKADIPTVETRGQLYMWLKEVVEITKPNIFVAENVKGLVNLANVKEIIQRDFANANSNGYLVLNPMVLHAADYGVPQSRERVIFIGIKKSALNSKALDALSKSIVPEKYNPYPKPSHSFTLKGKDLNLPVTLDKILADLPEPDKSTDPSQKYYSKAKFMGKHCQGQTEINMQSISPTIRAEHHGNIEFRRLSIENGGKNVDEVVKKKLVERRLTPRECALIQTFPPDYEFVIPSGSNRFFISPSVGYKLIGNAVPPLLAYHIAKRIEKLWNLYFNVNNNGNLEKSRTQKGSFSVITG